MEYLRNNLVVLQAHLKAAPVNATPKLLKELAKTGSVVP
jgi:hypothetical protein